MNDDDPRPPSDDGNILPRLRDATEVLEAIADDRALLVDVDEGLRKRLLIAAGQVSRPDKWGRRALARSRQRKDERVRRQADQALLDRTGIRQLRENPLFLTPRNQARHRGEASPSIGEMVRRSHPASPIISSVFLKLAPMISVLKLAD